MNNSEFHTLCATLAANWREPMPEVTVDMYERHIKAFDGELVLSVIEGELSDSRFRPLPLELRNAVRRRLQPEPAPQELMAELHDLVDRFGSYGVPNYDPTHGDGRTPGPSIGFGRVPRFSHQAIGAFVDQNGGWEKVCEAVNQQGKDPTQAAQMREHMKVCLAREREREQRAELGRGASPALEAE